MNFVEYVNGIEKCKRTSPFESSYQEVLSKLLEDVLMNTDIEVVVSKDFPRKCTQMHITSGYKKPGTASPDLILAKNFSYYNSDDKKLPETEYYALVEVKIPNTIKINKGLISLTPHDENQLKTYLDHSAIDKLIFTDGYTWVFYYKKFDGSSKKIIELKGKVNLEFWEGIAENTYKKGDNKLCEPYEWRELLLYIREFLKHTLV